MGYLGKISAVVAVNTGDFSSKLNRCKGDVEQFAAATSRSIASASQAAGRSFGSIYTNLQKFERALRAAQDPKLNFKGLKGFDGKTLAEAADHMRQIQSVATQISAPLAAAAKKSESLASAIRSGIHPALEATQARAQAMQTALENGTTAGKRQFNELEAVVRKTAQAMERVAEADAMVGRLSGGKNMRSQSPQAYSALSRASAMQGAIEKLPAGAIGASSSLLARQAAAARAVGGAYSRLESARDMGQDTTQAQADLDRRISRLNQVNDLIQQEISLYEQVAAEAKAADDAVAAAEERRKQAAAARLSMEQQFAQSLTGEAQNIDQLKSRYASLMATMAKLPAKNRASAGKAISGDVSIAQGIISSEDATQVSAAMQAISRAEAVLAAEAKSVKDAEDQATQAKKDAADAAQKLAKQYETLAALQARRLQVATGEAQTIDQLDSKYGTLISRLAKLPEAYRSIAAAAVAADAQMVETVISEGTNSDVSAVRGEMASIESVIAGYEDLTEKEKAAKKASDDLRESLARIADSIGQPAAPIDQATQAIDRMNSAIAKIKDPAQKAKAEQYAAGIRKDIEAEVALSGATGNAPAGSVMSGAAKRANKLADAADAINNAPAPPKKKTMDDIFGPVVGSRANQIDQLKTKIVSIHSEMEKLPVPLQMSLRPQLEKIRLLFENLGPKSTRKEIEDAARAAKLFGDEVERTNQSQKFGGSFGKFLDDTSAKKYEAELAAVQSKMAAVGATAGGPTAQAINAYRAALEKASLAGTLGTDAVRDNMRDLLVEIEKAIVAEGKLTEAQSKAIFGGIKREGDVSRGGGDKVGLALNQAAFAIDDFMSASGGFEMKVRAISNNLTQMAFILDGTRGLWVALSAVIATQASIAIYKFINNGKTADDTNKALNESLDKQKSLVGELAAAYRDLSKSMALSSAAQKGVANSGVIGSVAQANYNNRTQRLVGVDPSAVAERAMQLAIKRQMESSGVTGRAGTLIFREEQLKQSQARGRLAEAEARRRQPEQNADELQRMKERRAILSAEMGANTAARTAQAFGFDPAGDFAAFFNPQFRRAAEELENLEARIRATEGAVDEFSDKIGQAAIESAQVAQLRIEAAANLMASAIEAGVPGARKFQSELDSLSLELAAALNDLANASDMPTEQRREATQSAETKVNESLAKTADIIAKSLPLRIKAALSGPTSNDLLGSFSGGRLANSGVTARLAGAAAKRDVADAQLRNSEAQAATAVAEANRIKADGEKRIADARKALADVEMIPVPVGDEATDPYVRKAREEQRKRLEAATQEVERQTNEADAANQAAQANVAAAEAARDKARADAEAAMAADRAAAAFAKSALEIEEFLGRTRKIGDNAVAASENTADIRQRMYADKPTEENRRKRDEAEMQLISDREDVERAQARLNETRDRWIAQDPRVQAQNKIIADAEERIREIKEKNATNGDITGGAAIIGTEEDKIAVARAERDRIVYERTEGDRFFLDAANQRMKDRQEIAEMEARAPEFRAAERARVRQGREDAMTVRERQRLEAERGAENMAAAAGAFGTQAERKAFVQQFYDNRKKEILQSGPMGQAADERFNAMAPGARRIGIEASDVATAEGSRELNRLLRGDDANKDANFAEMQRQTELLSDIRDGIQANTGIGVIDR